MRIDEAAADLVVGSMNVTEAHNNRNGVMHGGAIMTFADTLAGTAASINLEVDRRTTTIESKTNFMRSIRIGDRITGRCVPIHKGRKLSIWQTTVYRGDGKPAAVVTQTQLSLVWEGEE